MKNFEFKNSKLLSFKGLFSLSLVDLSENLAIEI